MNAQDAQAQADTIEYYRLVMVAHQKDPYTPETARTDAEVLEMVKQNPDIIEMNKQFMDGGYAFRTARAMSVDGANSSAANHDALEEETIANLYRKRAEVLAKSTNYDELYTIGTKMDSEDEPIKNAHNRLLAAFTNAIDFLFQLAATKDGDSRGDGKKSSLEQALTEINELAPGKRFPDLFKVPMLRKRTCYSDEKLERIISLFEEINCERFQGRF